jgi:hypothetical protein
VGEEPQNLNAEAREDVEETLAFIRYTIERSQHLESPQADA